MMKVSCWGCLWKDIGYNDTYMINTVVIVVKRFGTSSKHLLLQLATTTETGHKINGFSSQQNKQRRNKIKIEIFTTMFLVQYFCLHNILCFKLNPEIENTRPAAKYRGRKSFDTWYYIVPCAMPCVSSSSKSKAIVFPKHSLKLNAHDQSIQARKNFFVMW